jgi:hypothetical protein
MQWCLYLGPSQAPALNVSPLDGEILYTTYQNLASSGAAVGLDASVLRTGVASLETRTSTSMTYIKYFNQIRAYISHIEPLAELFQNAIKCGQASQGPFSTFTHRLSPRLFLIPCYNTRMA